MSNIAQGIRQRGFRRWYERELVQSHLHLLLLVLAVLGLLGALEAGAQRRSLGDAWWLMAVCAVTAAAVGVLALRRYLFLLLRAEHIANQAHCPHCKAYARWTIEAPCSLNDSGAFSVCCKACRQRWRIQC